MEKNNTSTLKEHASHDQTVIENCHGGEHTLPFKNPSFPRDTEVQISLADHAHPWKSVLWDTWLQAPISGPRPPLCPALGQSQENPVLGLDLPHPLGSAGCQNPWLSESLVIRIPGCQKPWLPLPDHLLHSPSQEPGLQESWGALRKGFKT